MSRLYLGKVQDVIDNGEKTVCRPLDIFGALFLLFVELCIDEKLSHTDDTCDWCSYFM